MLNTLRARLQMARQAAEAAGRSDAAVPARELVKLAHRDESSVQSATQAAAAAAAAEREATRKLRESPATAAAAVRAELQRLGCCTEAEGAFLAGFEGRSNNFKYWEAKASGTSRAPGADARRKLEHLPPCEELASSGCCAQQCARHMSAANFERWRSRYGAVHTVAFLESFARRIVPRYDPTRCERPISLGTYVCYLARYVI